MVPARPVALANRGGDEAAIEPNEKQLTTLRAAAAQNEAESGTSLSSAATRISLAASAARANLARLGIPP